MINKITNALKRFKEFLADRKAFAHALKLLKADVCPFCNEEGAMYETNIPEYSIGCDECGVRFYEKPSKNSPYA